MDLALSADAPVLETSGVRVQARTRSIAEPKQMGCVGDYTGTRETTVGNPAPSIYEWPDTAIDRGLRPLNTRQRLKEGSRSRSVVLPPDVG